MTCLSAASDSSVGSINMCSAVVTRLLFRRLVLPRGVVGGYPILAVNRNGLSARLFRGSLGGYAYRYIFVAVFLRVTLSSELSETRVVVLASRPTASIGWALDLRRGFVSVTGTLIGILTK